MVRQGGMGAERQSRIWIDDGHAIFRRGIAACLTAIDLTVVGQSALLRPPPLLNRVDLLIFEAEPNSIRMVLRFSREGSAGLLALVHDPRDVVVCELLEAGISAVLPHADLTCEALISAVRAVLSGNAVVPAPVMPGVLAHARSAGRQAPGTLSEREREVLKLLADGSDTREIAIGLCFSERTVKNVVHDILMKLNCRTRAHAVAMATRAGVI
jgi:DNA-binding NarL/FixJ family response regulator